jgi:hypothetical protein
MHGGYTMDAEEVEVEEEAEDLDQVEAVGDEIDELEGSEEHESQDEDAPMLPAYKEDVEEVIYRLRGDISELSKKKKKYDENVDAEIVLKQRDIHLLERVTAELPERPQMAPDLPFGRVGEGPDDVDVPAEENDDELEDDSELLPIDDDEYEPAADDEGEGSGTRSGTEAEQVEHFEDESLPEEDELPY